MSGKTMRECDGCGKLRRDVRSCGRDSAGDTDGPDLCFLCRTENIRGRIFDAGLGRYVPLYVYHTGRALKR